MRSYRVTKWSEPLELEERDVPSPAGREVLVRTTAAGVCHSDLHIHDGFYDFGGGKVLRRQARKSAGLASERLLGLPLAAGAARRKRRDRRDKSDRGDRPQP